MTFRWFLLFLLLLPNPLRAAGPVPVAVAAAADLRLVLPPMVTALQARTGATYRLSFGSSGQMVQQAINGAPFQLLLLADHALAQRLADAVPGVERRAYALGRLALVVPPGSAIRDLGSLKAAIAARQVKHLAIANPAHAPYGAAAQAVLRKAGIGHAPLVLGDNVAQALTFVTSGAADAGIVALPLARASGGVTVLPISPGLHPPLLQTLVIMPGASPAARALADAVTGPGGQAALKAAGFGTP
ncbi:molybdate ABC transporter substrate-binding protein [Sandarakinorhabdus cyanobacteriorum]|uniref:Molybdate ABC transporter substrate-binding protein n=1 Tax=Sandarakinorhabdus cyanobacteriorum TaxID=1981098 RepID=A0A255YD59_9SPHN|nr:molybdate ABC transporter substrate-binding protein [Sandarakinorhabdus cyanobacteriorum]OYQ27103.1 molybdate ABC transporter substrate-binding protein [Sandarakinorhabdus cyanobacteriorum]